MHKSQKRHCQIEGKHEKCFAIHISTVGKVAFSVVIAIKKFAMFNTGYLKSLELVKK